MLPETKGGRLRPPAARSLGRALAAPMADRITADGRGARAILGRRATGVAHRSVPSELRGAQ